MVSSIKGRIGIRALIFEVKTWFLANDVASHAAFSGDAQLIFRGLIQRDILYSNNKIIYKNKLQQINPHHQ